MKAVYPVVFTATNDEKGTVLIEAPDINSTSEGYGMYDAIKMARELIELHCVEMEDDGGTPPGPSNIKDIDLDKAEFKDVGESVLSLVEIDTDMRRRMLSRKSVRRNATLPEWLNAEAERAKINVSRVLQEALMEAVGTRV